MSFPIIFNYNFWDVMTSCCLLVGVGVLLMPFDKMTAML